MKKATKEFVRMDGRTCTQVRPLSIQYDQFGFADCSVTLHMGRTIVHVAVSLQESVPPFLRGSGTGWLTAEYAMLPTATTKRTPRDSETGKKQGRSVEIARMIGRSLRSVLDYKAVGERTIFVDCDVLQADGGTRAACITAASYALVRAIERWKERGMVPAIFAMKPILALSAGIVQDRLMVDLTQQEDTSAQVDVTFVCTYTGDLAEIQGTGEKGPLCWEFFAELYALCRDALPALIIKA